MKNKVLSIVMTLLFMISGSLSAQTAYAVFCEGDNSLHFLCSDEILEEGATLPSTGQVITKLWSGTAVTNSGYSPKWSNQLHIAKVVFENSFKTARPQSCRWWFEDFVDLKTIEGIENLNTSNVTSMEYMFWGCRSLTSLDLSNLNAPSVTDMSDMFYGCSLTSLDLSNLNAPSVTDMSYMFAGRSSLTSLDLSNLNAPSVTDMSSMFHGCRSLTSLDLSNLSAPKVTDMSDMFYGCSSLTSLDLSSFNTSNVTSMKSMFYGCSSLTSLDLSNLSAPSVTDMNDMFKDCRSLTSLDLSNLSAPSVTDMSSMFYGCRSLTSLDLSNLSAPSVTDMSSMFWGCSSLTFLDLSNLYTPNVRYMGRMFSGCSSLASLDLSSFDTSNVTNMKSMFYGCSSLTSLDLSSFNTSNVTDMSWMFSGCSSLTSLDLSNFDTSNIQQSTFPGSKYYNMRGMFSLCSGLRLLDMSKAKITNLDWCTSLNNAALTYVPEGTPVSENAKNVIIGNKCEHLVVDYDKKNGQLLLSVPYEFTADKVTINRDFIANTPQTLYLPFEISSTAYGTFYTYGGYNENDGSIKFNKLNAANTTANKAYLFKPNSDGAIEIEGSVAVKKTAAAKTETTSLNGIYEKKKFTEDEIRKGVYFELKDGEFVRVDDNTEIDACQAYMMLSNGNAGDNLTVAYSDATGISDVSPDGSGLQAPAYNISGLRVNSSYKGVVIRNGKKIIVK